MRILSKSRSGDPGVRMLLEGQTQRGLRGIRRLIKNNPSDGLTQPEADGLYQLGAQASLTTACAGADNDLVYTADLVGSGGNSIRVRYVVAGASTPLTVVVAGNDITVNVATNGGSAATSTASQVKTAVDGSAPAAALISTALKAGDSGAGVVAAFAYANLTGGVDRTKMWGVEGPSVSRVRTLSKTQSTTPGQNQTRVSKAGASPLRRR